MEVEFETVVTVGGSEVPVLATVDVDGEYRPGTWEDPPESPEASVVSVVRLDTGAELPLSALSESDIDCIETRAVEEANDDEPDDGDDY